MNNTSPPERADAYLSMNHSSISVREESPGEGEDLGQRTDRTFGRREIIRRRRERASVYSSDEPSISSGDKPRVGSTSCRGCGEQLRFD